MHGIYKIYCTANGKSYIGSSVDIKKRWICHKSELENKKHRNRHLQNAWLKYGSEAFEWSVLELVLLADNLISREQHWLDGTPDKFNLRKEANSNLGLIVSLETRAKIGAANKGRKLSPEHIAKMKGRKLSPETRAKMKGRVLSAETRAKVSAAQTGRKHSLETRAKRSAALKGKKHSAESKAKMSAATKGRKKSPEHVNKMRGRVCSPETRAKISESLKRRADLLEWIDKL
jgi:group I intron endonuclease